MFDLLPAPLLFVMMLGIPIGLIVLLDIVLVIRGGWSASMFYPPMLRQLEIIMSMPVIEVHAARDAAKKAQADALTEQRLD